MRDIVPEERQSRCAQPPLAPLFRPKGVAAARRDLLRCRLIRMKRHHFLPTPRISPRGARNAAYGTSDARC